MRPPAPTVLDRVLAAFARRALRRGGVRQLLALEVGPVRREGDLVYVPDRSGGWRAAATVVQLAPPRWRPSGFWQRPRDPAPSGWYSERPSDPAHAPGGRRMP